ncbi:unnamed protein product [Symbiodinium sp. CCMP2456]|nr:unnamed protein product [Symbiodinium sp. CCMP2456]
MLDRMELEDRTINFLFEAATQYSLLAPAVSRALARRMRVFASAAKVNLHASSVEQLMCPRCSQVYVPGYNCHVSVKPTKRKRKDSRITKSRTSISTRKSSYSETDKQGEAVHQKCSLPTSSRRMRHATGFEASTRHPKRPRILRRWLHYICRWCKWRRCLLLPCRPQRPQVAARPAAKTLAEKKQAAVNEEARNAAKAAKRLKQAKAKAKSAATCLPAGAGEDASMRADGLAPAVESSGSAAGALSLPTAIKDREESATPNVLTADQPKASPAHPEAVAKQEPKAKRRPRQDKMSRALAQFGHAAFDTSF